ncbi:Alpha/Beta hydrolase protein [Aspergillus pseudotamarii]|uniref:Carboxylic ester hydrolase n=1 Tax=Aspergillus pseudotamarii TaxID=132259 RepID=A0A5N6T1Y2_ASPPS|nr:Alpha/Beta hydrolase protein [Aspergillus pseudotamarii]KAE8140303.1 Alpha/Beta hydrolase protein [Aspergillus pseudotamarii]
MKIVLPLFATAWSLLGTSNADWIVGQSVPTTSGLVIGHAAADASEVSEYVGIPYAQPPLGNLRFQPPVAYHGDGTINATSFVSSTLRCLSAITLTLFLLLTPTVSQGPSCIQPPSAASNNTTSAPPQNLGIPPMSPVAFTTDEYAESEDCLTLNVWTKPQTGEKKKAVLVWIYGGAYVSGSSNQPGYRGQFIADQTDVIVVSMNYRVNIFGFPGDPASPANLGLRDVRLALEWIRDNIAQFGGDTARITIFGQSAGAGIVDFYSFAYADDPIASGFIEMSATLYGFPALTAEESNDRWFHVTRLVGCGDATSNPEAVSTCMVNRTVDEILAGYDPATVPLNPSPYGPVVDNDVVFSSYLDRRAAKGGYLIGNTQNEAGLFKLLQPPQSEAYWNDFNDRLYTCADKVRIEQSIADGNPTWRYRYFGDFPNLVLSTTPPSGAYHGSELGPLFDTVNQTLLKSTAAEVAVGDYLREVWSSFAKDPRRGLDAFWPQYTEMGSSLARIGFNNMTMSLGSGEMYDHVCRWSYDGVSPPAVLGSVH